MTDTAQANPPHYNDSSLLRASDIFSTPKRRGVLPIGKTTFYRWIAEGLVPNGKKISGTPLWPYAAIRQLAEKTPAPLSDSGGALLDDVSGAM